MWLGDPGAYCVRFGISPKRALRFQCTAEHLVARQDNGGDEEDNIVAACRHCNWQRHWPRLPTHKAASPLQFREQVQAEVAQRRWHPKWAWKAGIMAQRQGRSSGFRMEKLLVDEQIQMQLD
ncbi:hypothetical protein B1810_22065 [Panacagrimonas perspica]|nr:hypothetical protein B1810_22065 [Panacagrimonas perspica]